MKGAESHIMYITAVLQDVKLDTATTTTEDVFSFVLRRRVYYVAYASSCLKHEYPTSDM